MTVEVATPAQLYQSKDRKEQLHWGMGWLMTFADLSMVQVRPCQPETAPLNKLPHLIGTTWQFSPSLHAAALTVCLCLFHHHASASILSAFCHCYVLASHNWLSFFHADFRYQYSSLPVRIENAANTLRDRRTDGNPLIACAKGSDCPSTAYTATARGVFGIRATHLRYRPNTDCRSRSSFGRSNRRSGQTRSALIGFASDT